MKKSFALALIMTFALSLCAHAYAPGTYSASANGNNGKVEVAVTFDAEKITGIEITNHDETPGLGTVAFEQMIPAIIAAQSTNVDGFSGATNSSNALKEAVDNCIAQASK